MTDRRSYPSFPQPDYVARPEIDSKFNALEANFDRLERRFNDLRNETRDFKRDVKEDVRHHIEKLEERTKDQLDREDRIIDANRQSMEHMNAETSRSIRWITGLIISMLLSVAGMIILLVRIASSEFLK